MTMQNTHIEEALQWRYACKKFDPLKKISDADWKTLKDSLVLTPTSYGLQMMKFLVVQDYGIREKLRAVSWNQSQVTDCSHYVVFLARTSITENDVTKFIDRMVEVRGVAKESLDGYRNMMLANLVKTPHPDPVNWTKKQAYIAMGFLLETAALLKVDTVPMEGLDPVAYDKILGLEGTGWTTAMTVALGYRSSEDQYQHAKKVRFAENDLIQYV
jgi:nitroreductase